MSDPRLRSVHLEANPRRQDYRRAREELLSGCGQQTLDMDRGRQAESPSDPTQGAAPSRRFSLKDQDGLHSLKFGLNTIGRLPDNDIPVDDGSVSRRHCTIVVHASHVCEVYDTASRNGTFVNGERINSPTALLAGDKIQLCGRQFIFVDAEVPATNDETHFER